MSTDIDQALAPMRTILVTGGSGYLGQFLVQDLAAANKVGFTHHSTSAPRFAGAVQDFWIDMATGEGLLECFERLGPLDAVINCAAISVPAACEKDVDLARRVNVPLKLLEALARHKQVHSREPLLIQLSTDQVYDGSRAWWREDDGCSPVNAYGLTKRQAEVVIQDRWPNHIILRSSIIYGPQSPEPVSRQLFLQFIDTALAAGKLTSFFDDEFRCPIYVHDIVAIIKRFLDHKGPLAHRTFNMGGPQRLSRADMARQVAQCWGYDPAAIQAVPSSSVQRSAVSPPDISMDVSRLLAALPGVQLTPLLEALEAMRPYCRGSLDAAEGARPPRRRQSRGGSASSEAAPGAVP